MAQGGFQVGALARLRQSEGVLIDTLDLVKAEREITTLMKRSRVVIFEAAVQTHDLVARIDVLVKDGDRLRPTGIEAKSFDADDTGFWCKKEDPVFDMQVWARHIMRKLSEQKYAWDVTYAWASCKHLSEDLLCLKEKLDGHALAAWDSSMISLMLDASIFRQRYDEEAYLPGLHDAALAAKKAEKQKKKWRSSIWLWNNTIFLASRKVLTEAKRAGLPSAGPSRCDRYVFRHSQDSKENRWNLDVDSHAESQRLRALIPEP